MRLAILAPAMSSADSNGGLNGSSAALGVDRAILDLRQGRAIAIVDGGRSLVVTALEAISQAMLDRLLGTSSAVVLLVTAERAQSARLNGAIAGPIAISVRHGCRLETLRAYGGMAGPGDRYDTALSVRSWQGSVALAAAGYELAKAGRLIPALVGFETDGATDPTVAAVTLAAIRERSDLAHQGLVRVSSSHVPIADAEKTSITLFRDTYSGSEHVAVVIGDPEPGAAVPVRMHSACLTGDVFGSLRCDCGEQLKLAVRRIAELGCGALLYLDQEGRGIGLANKLRAYAIQDSGLDTLDADRHLGFSADERTFDVAAAMLKELGIARVEIMTNNPQKIAALRENGIEVVGRLPLIGSMNAHNESYLRAKLERAGHLACDGAA